MTIWIEKGNLGYFIVGTFPDEYRTDYDWITLFKMDPTVYCQHLTEFNGVDKSSFVTGSAWWTPCIYFTTEQDAQRAIKKFYEPRVIMTWLVQN